jgi:hypothetical protein
MQLAAGPQDMVHVSLRAQMEGYHVRISPEWARELEKRNADLG